MADPIGFLTLIAKTLIAKISSFFNDAWLFFKGRSRERIQHDAKIYDEFSAIFSDTYIEGVIKGTEKDYSNNLVCNKQRIKDFDEAIRKKFIDSNLQGKFHSMVCDLLSLADQLEKQNGTGVELSDNQKNIDISLRKKLSQSYKIYRGLIKKS